MSVFLKPRGRALRLGLVAFALGLASFPAVAGPMATISTLCHDASRNGHEIRETLEATGWQQAVVDRDGLYTDLATTLVLEITDSSAGLAERLAQAPLLAGNFEQMVLSGVARIYQQAGALLYVASRPGLEGGEQVTCILGTPRSPETLALMEQHGGAESDPETDRIVRRVVQSDGPGPRSMRLWARLLQEPPPTPLPDLFYMERVTPAG